MNRNDSSQELFGTRPTLSPVVTDHLRTMYKGGIESIDQLESFIHRRNTKNAEAKALESPAQQVNARRTIFMLYVTVMRVMTKFTNPFVHGGYYIKWNAEEERALDALSAKTKAVAIWMNTPSSDGKNLAPCAFTVSLLPRPHPAYHSTAAIVPLINAGFGPEIV